MGANESALRSAATLIVLDRRGSINTPGRDEIYSCKSCRVSMDRDIMASRNILIKNIYA